MAPFFCKNTLTFCQSFLFEILFWKLRKKFNGRIGGNGAVGRGSDELAEIFGATVAGGKKPGEISGAGIVGNNETRLIEK